MSERDLLLGASVILLIFGAFYFRPTDEKPEPELVVKSPTVPAFSEIPSTDDCTKTERVDHCLASTEVKIERCTKSAAKQAVDELLGQPLKTAACEKLMADMEANCPKGCGLDYGGILAIPGKISFSILSGPDESGRCLIRGAREVGVRARCAPADK